MKKNRIIPIVCGVAVLAFALIFISHYCSAKKSQQEILRMKGVRALLMVKLDGYKALNGYYPDSTEALSFTNSAQEVEMLPDIRKIEYRRTESGYTLRYNGVSSFRFPSDAGTN